MKIITKYLSKDGIEFNTESACLKHEKYYDKIQKVESILGKKRDDCAFANGCGYYQHTKEKVEKYRAELLNLAKRLDSKISEKTHVSFICRILGDSGDILLNSYDRLNCIDSEFREWGQPYYAAHPNEGEQVKLN